MKKLTSVALILACLSVFAVGATVESQNVVGFFKVDVASNDYSLVSVPMQKLAVYTGQASGSSSNTITISGSDWTAGEFSNMVDSAVAGGIYTESGLSTYYVEIAGDTNGAYYGRHYFIADNTANTLTTTGGDFGFGDLTGVTFKIVPAQRIRDVFGEPGSPVLAQGSSPDQSGGADGVLLWNGGWNTYYHHIALGYWTSTLNFPNDRSNDVIDRDEGFFVRRFSGATNLVITGEVTDNSREIVISGSGTYDLVRIQSEADVAIGNSQLAASFAAGTSPDAAGGADGLLAWVNGGWVTVYRHSVLGYWTSTAAFPTDISNTFILEAGKGYFVLRHTTATSVTSESPLQ
ncbi:hypothetical protein BVX97_05260 [bacterium E08(2017)]|nr:hypothetical protein BVX97_05260 [bacterium E08(2017)]